jgi:hypothetical protein
MRIAYVLGARPNFVKMAPVIAELRRRMPDGGHTIIHTGQHYDRMMSDVFLEDLGVPEPDHMLGVGSAGHAVQTARVMERIEPVLEEEHPDLVIVPGDVNSTLAATLVAVKLGIPVAHLESGLRSFDRTMPEEINRIVADEFACALQGASPLCITRPRVEKGGRFGAHPRNPRRERCRRGRGVRAPPPSQMQAPGPLTARASRQHRLANHATPQPRPLAGGCQMTTSSRWGCAGGPYCRPRIARASSAWARRMSVRALVACWPLSIREIADAVVPMRAASCCWESPSAARRMMTSLASASNGARRSCSARTSGSASDASMSAVIVVPIGLGPGVWCCVGVMCDP